MVFEYEHDRDEETHYVLYRPALLNGRHLVDVMRTALGPADVDQAEFDRVKREATAEAMDETVEGGGWEGVWEIFWEGAKITAEA